MKKRLLYLFTLSLLAGCFTRYSSLHAVSSGTSSTAKNSDSFQTCETNQTLSSKEQKNQDEEEKNEIVKQYSIYKEFGLTYDKNKDSFYYDGKKVRYFKDTVTDSKTNAFYYDDGVIDLTPVRDSNGNLTGLLAASQKEFDVRTEKQKKADISSSSTDSVSGEPAGSFEEGSTNLSDHTLDAYLEYGISYNSQSQSWMYNGKPISFLKDSDILTYADYGVAKGVSIQVIRDEKNKIKELTTAR